MPIRVAGAQMNLCVGDLPGNESKILGAIDWAEEQRADVLLLPELAVNGYPPEDLVLRADFVSSGLDVLERLAERSASTTIVVGLVDRWENGSRGGDDSTARMVANGAAVLANGRVEGIYHKVLLPNYGVFDEDRYFSIGDEPARVWDVGGIPVGVSICEDIWRADGPPSQQAEAGARALLNINASPFHRGKADEREEMIVARAIAAGVSVVYLNLVGGQDELVFDGCSLVVAYDGSIVHRSPQFEEDLFVVDVPLPGEPIEPARISPHLDRVEEVYRALEVGLGDYVRKNGFESVVLGLSGGIDSALTAAIAADALG
ncbi:MAG: nitrilase-related carbon-nitrogen hydrolase, partial [Acidimicrobiia bacterium]